MQANYDWDCKGAESSVRRALELAPGDADVIWSACVWAMLLGRPHEMVALGRRAVALDPLRAAGHSLFGSLLLDGGFLDEAEAELKTALDLSPGIGTAYLNLARVHQAQGRGEEAMREAERETIEEIRLLGAALVYHANGRASESNMALRIASGSHDWATGECGPAMDGLERKAVTTWVRRGGGGLGVGKGRHSSRAPRFALAYVWGAHMGLAR